MNKRWGELIGNNQHNIEKSEENINEQRQQQKMREQAENWELRVETKRNATIEKYLIKTNKVSK